MVGKLKSPRRPPAIPRVRRAASVTEPVDWEARLLWKIREAGLPEPTREFFFAKPLGREWRADFAYPEEMILIEVEGGIFSKGRHVRGKGYEEDAEKYNTAELMGYKVIRVTSNHVTNGKAIYWIKVAFGLEELEVKKGKRRGRRPKIAVEAAAQ